MKKGRVKWFNNAKGFGFINSENSEEDIFVHFSSVQGSGYKSLLKGQPVTFSTEDGPKGLQAVDVVTED